MDTIFNDFRRPINTNNIREMGKIVAVECRHVKIAAVILVA
jgi:hypothetical protein